MDFRPEGSRNARRIILMGGRFLLNDRWKKKKSSRRDLTRVIGDLFLWMPAGKRQGRVLDYRPEDSLNARPIILTGGRFLLND
jgi:hypothetical protein